MTARELIDALSIAIAHGMPESVIIIAYDARFNKEKPITGFLYSSEATLALRTDDMKAATPDHGPS